MPNYRYNGHLLPASPEYDTTLYKNAYIVKMGVLHQYFLILLPTGWSYVYNQQDEDSMNYIGTSGGTGIMYAEYDNLHGWQYEDSVPNPVIYSDSLTPVWSNFDILNEDGTVYLAASEPVKAFCLRSWLTSFALGLSGKPLPLAVAPKWETLFEGDVTTATGDAHDGFYGTFQPMLINPYPCDNADTERIYRLTVDGVPATQVVGIEADCFAYYPGYYVGNLALWADDRVPDDGTDFCMLVMALDPNPQIYADNTWFVSRNAGTYHVKVERLLKDPVAYSYNGTVLPPLPKSGYACILTSTSGAAKLLYPSEMWAFSYSEEQEAFVAQSSLSVECYVCDPAQGRTEWVRSPDRDAELVTGDAYPVPGETMLWANERIYWDVEAVFTESRAMPIFNYGGM